MVVERQSEIPAVEILGGEERVDLSLPMIEFNLFSVTEITKIDQLLDRGDLTDLQRARLLMVREGLSLISLATNPNTTREDLGLDVADEELSGNWIEIGRGEQVNESNVTQAEVGNSGEVQKRKRYWLREIDSEAASELGIMFEQAGVTLSEGDIHKIVCEIWRSELEKLIGSGELSDDQAERDRLFQEKLGLEGLRPRLREVLEYYQNPEIVYSGVVATEFPSIRKCQVGGIVKGAVKRGELKRYPGGIYEKEDLRRVFRNYLKRQGRE